MRRTPWLAETWSSRIARRTAAGAPRAASHGAAAALELVHDLAHVLRALARDHEQRVVRLHDAQIAHAAQGDHARLRAGRAQVLDQVVLAVDEQRAGLAGVAALVLLAELPH